MHAPSALHACALKFPSAYGEVTSGRSLAVNHMGMGFGACVAEAATPRFELLATLPHGRERAQASPFLRGMFAPYFRVKSPKDFLFSLVFSSVMPFSLLARLPHLTRRWCLAILFPPPRVSDSVYRQKLFCVHQRISRQNFVSTSVSAKSFVS